MRCHPRGEAVEVTSCTWSRSQRSIKGRLFEAFLLSCFGFRKDRFRELPSRNESMKIVAAALILAAVAIICCTAMPKKREYAYVALHHSMVAI